MPRKKKNKKIIRYRRPLSINIGVVIFCLIFVYMGFSIYIYMTKNHIQSYEVLLGTIVDDKKYSGIILRNEEVKYTEQAGTISYYIREGKKAAVGSMIYALDETGRMSEILTSSEEEGNSLSQEGLSELKKQLATFSITYKDDDFSQVYEMKYDLETTVFEYAEAYSPENLAELLSTQGVRQIRADQAGIVAYSVDGMEGLTEAEIQADLFDRSDYNRQYVKKQNEMVDVDAPAYKIVTTDNWSIIFPLTAEDVEQFQETQSLQVTFTDKRLETTGAFSMITGQDGATYGKLDFKKYMVQFLSDRYVSFEIVQNKEEGLKIPVSSVVSKNFYTIPLDYITQGGNNEDEGFMRKDFDENGESTIVFINTEIYYKTEEVCYIDANQLKAGNVLVKPDSSEEYSIGAMASLDGVYNMNKGFAVFRQIDIIDQNEEYCIVRKNMPYGLSVYDHIVLDGSQVEENDLIH